MSDFVGRRIAVGFAKETTRGTAVAPEYWTPHLSLDFESKNEKAINESALGVIEKNNDSEIVREWAEGSVEGKVTDESIGLLLLAAFGTVSTSANADASGNVYDHEFTVAQDNAGTALTLTKKDPNNDLAYTLAVLSSFELSVEVGEYVKVTTEWVAKKGASATSTVAYSDEREFVARHAVLKVAADEASLSGASAQPVSAATLTLTRNADPRFEFGSNEPNEITNGAYEVDITLTKRFSDNTFRTYWENNSKIAFSLTLTNTDETIGTAANPVISFTLPRVVVNEWDHGKGLDDISEEEVSIKALYDTDSSKLIEALVTNLVTSY